MTAYIYALQDPRTYEVRYIGKSVSPKNRLRNHINGQRYAQNWRMRQWIGELRADARRPVLMIVDECDLENWQERERHWIKIFREVGSRLCNIESGGNGLHAATYEMRANMRAAAVGKTLTAEHKARIAAAHRGKKRAPFSDEWLRNMSNARRGKKKRPMSQEGRRNISLATSGKRLSEAHRRAISEGLLRHHSATS